jgi:GNAT superfamily N-acetyltransferase
LPASRIEIRVIRVEAALPVRLASLRPGETLDMVRIENDDEGLHLGAFLEGELVSVASLFVSGGKAQFRKFATLPAYQGRGIGTQLLARMIEEAKAAGTREFWCNARLDALSIYQRAGMRPAGTAYEKDGRTYIRMSLPL